VITGTGRTAPLLIARPILTGVNYRPEAAEVYALRLGNQFKEENTRLNAEFQYNYHFQKIGLSLVTGLSYQKDQPNSFGITLLDSAKRIMILQAGAVLQLEKTLPLNFRFVAAGRLDHHSKLGNFFSPKLALVKKAGEGSFRLTWAKAYSMPSILFQYSKVGNQTFGNGTGIVYVPNNTSITNMNDPAYYKTTTPLKPEEITTWEIGYKGTIANKFYIDIDYYNGMSKNFLGTSQRIDGLAKYTGEGIKLYPANTGQIIRDTLQKANFLTYFNYSAVRVYGLDLALNYYFNSIINLGFKYSWFGSDITSDDIKNDANGDGVVTKEETSMNTPSNRFIISLGLENLCKGKVFVNVSARFLQSYDFYSGVQIGTEAGEGKRGFVTRGKPYNDTLYKISIMVH
jgi:iron complex outermembrane receptor protein